MRILDSIQEKFYTHFQKQKLQRMWFLFHKEEQDMHKFHQRLLSSLLCLAMVASFVPTIAAAVENEVPAETETALIETVETVIEETEATAVETAEVVIEETEATAVETTEVVIEETEAAAVETTEVVIEETEAAPVETTEVIAEESKSEEPAAATEAVAESIPVGPATQTISIDHRVEQNEDGALIVVESNTTATVAGAGSTLPKLSAPTNLEWGYSHRWEWDEEQQTSVMIAKPWPGSISWKPSEASQSHTRVQVYNTASPDEPCWQTTIHYGSTDIPEWRSEDLFTADSPESGSYYFTITEIGDGINYSDSDTVTSDVWTYTKPSAKLDLCTNLGWEAKHPYNDDGPVPTFTYPANDCVGGYDIEILFAKTAAEEPHFIGGIMSAYGAAPSEQDYGFMPDEYIQENGSGFYYFKIKTLSSDITKFCNSDWSALSPAYNLTDVVNNVQSELKDVVADKDSLSEEEIRDAVQSMDTTELKNAMLADESVVSNVAALEEQVGGPAPVEVSKAASDFDADKISIVGANLNNAESADPIKLVIDKPEKNHVIDTAYNNSVAVKFSMDLENVADTENLAVPVKITMPIPAKINPDFLVILHYHANGTMEELRYPNNVSIYKDGNQHYASFVLTSFSDFVMTQFSSVPVYRLYNPYTQEHLLTGGVEERDALISVGWSLDGVAWEAPVEGIPVFRLYNPYDDWHTYTTSEEERDSMVAAGWKVDGVVSLGYTGQDGRPIYRLFNPYVQTNYHLFTAGVDERDLLVSVGWILEGVAWHAVK